MKEGTGFRILRMGYGKEGKGNVECEHSKGTSTCRESMVRH